MADLRKFFNAVCLVLAPVLITGVSYAVSVAIFGPVLRPSKPLYFPPTQVVAEYEPWIWPQVVIKDFGTNVYVEELSRGKYREPSFNKNLNCDEEGWRNCCEPPPNPPLSQCTLFRTVFLATVGDGQGRNGAEMILTEIIDDDHIRVRFPLPRIDKKTTQSTTEAIINREPLHLAGGREGPEYTYKLLSIQRP